MIRKALWLLLVVWSAWPKLARAQEFIPNGGFESYRTCPWKDNLLEEATPWYNPSITTPDFYNQCLPLTQLQLPPHSGRGLGRLFFDLNWAEYMASPLKKPLEAGECYYFEMYAATPTPNKVISGTLGAFFTKDSLYLTEKALFNVRPQVLDRNARTFTRPFQWERIGNHFVAQGGEKYVLIGNFNQFPAQLGDYYTFLDDLSLKPVRLNLGRDTTLCGRSSTLLLDATTPAATRYEWSDGSDRPTLKVSRPGKYFVTVTTPCKLLRDTIQVDYVVDFTLGRDTTLCNGQTLTLKAPAEPGTRFWQDNSTGPQYTVSRAGTYWLQVTEKTCTASDSITVRFIPPPQLNLGIDQSLCGAETVTIRPQYAEGTFRWDDGAPEERLITRSGYYRASVQSDCATLRDTVRVDYGACGCVVYVPDAFTPNHDGTNETFEPFGCGDITIRSLTIYTRWGEPLFRTTATPFRWGGTYQNQSVPPGIYVWKADYLLRQGEEEIPLSKEGIVSVIR